MSSSSASDCDWDRFLRILSSRGTDSATTKEAGPYSSPPQITVFKMTYLDLVSARNWIKPNVFVKIQKATDTHYKIKVEVFVTVGKYAARMRS